MSSHEEGSVSDGASAAAALSVKIRTLAGKELVVEGLSGASKIVDLKKAIFAQNEDFAPEYQRLLLHGQGLGGGDDEVTLEAAGVDGKTPIHLVRRLRGRSLDEGDKGASPSQDSGIVQPKQSGTITLIVPDGIQGGQ